METAQILGSLDEIDRKILFELDRDSRQSVAELSRKLALGRDRINYRIKKLQTSKILRGFSTAINPYRFGLVVYKTYLKLENNKRRIGHMLADLERHKHVTWMAECDGRWDLMFSILAKDPQQFHSLQEKILFDFSDIITDVHVYTVVHALCFRKSYLLEERSDHFVFGGPPEQHKLDRIDFNILKLLSEDSRTPIKKIAAVLGSTAMVVQYRIKKLEELGIIIGYRVDLDLSSLGMMFFKAQLDLASFGRHDQEELLEYCKNDPHITYYIRQMGECLVEIELEVADFQQYNAIIDDLRERFCKFIRSVESSSVREQSFKWIPFDSPEDM